MSTQVNVAHINSYTNIASLLLQQKGSKLMNVVTRKNVTGKAAKVYEQIGKVQGREKTARHQNIEYTNTPHAARWAHPKTKYVADRIDDDDKLKSIIELQPAYIQTQMYGLGRDVDDEVISMAFGTCYTGENGTTTESWSTSYDIAHGSQGLTIDKIADAKELMMAADWDETNDPAYLVVGSKQYRDLLTLTQMTSSDFNGGRPVIRDGKLESVLGFNIIHVNNNLLPVASNIRECMVFAKSGICLGMWEDLNTNVKELPDTVDTSRILSKMVIGATRTELGKVIKIKCSEA